jgi:hypothetical protein
VAERELLARLRAGCNEAWEENSLEIARVIDEADARREAGLD